MKKLIIFTAAIILFATSAFAQKDMSVTEVEELIQSKGLIHRLDFVFGVEPLLAINTHIKNSEGKFISAPSPISMPLYIGLAIPNYTPLSFQPSLRFFAGYNLVCDNMVLPAEIENRTGLTLNFLLNLPIVFKLNYKDKYSWSILAGIAGFVYLLRVGSGDPSHASGMEMNAIASSIIGGTMLTGGVGNIIGTFVGVLSLGTIQNVVASAGFDDAWWIGISTAGMLCLFIVIQSVVVSKKKKLLAK